MPLSRNIVVAAAFAACVSFAHAGLQAPAKQALPPDWVQQFKWRCIGPATMGGRITAIGAYEADPTTYYVGLAEGGLLRTNNAGNTFDIVFDHAGSSSVGAVCVAPSDRKIVWVGTGEANPRNSVSYGDGVYKSTDGGQTWTNMGLKGTFQIGKIVIDPKNPDVVYVGALGRLWGANKDRGLYKTTDGGKTWKQVLYLDDRTGVIDMVMDPTHPNTLVVATWERLRDAYDSHDGRPRPPEGYDGYDPAVKYGKNGGLYKTTDGGKTFRKLTNGLPSCAMGRIGLDIYRKNPNVLFAIVDSEKIGTAPPLTPVYIGVFGQSSEKGVTVTDVTTDAPADKAGLKIDDVVTHLDGKPVNSYLHLLEELAAKKAGQVVTLTVRRGDKDLQLKVTVAARPQTAAELPSLRALLQAMTEDVPEGIKISRLVDEGAAQAAGLVDGDVIVRIGSTAVANSEALQKALATAKSGDKVRLTVRRAGAEKTVQVELAESSGMGMGPTRSRPFGGNMGGQQQNVQDRQGVGGEQCGGVYRSDDGGESWKRVNSLNPRPMYFSVVRVDPSDDRYVYVLGISMYRSSDGGKTFRADGANQVHPDQHDLWIDSKDGRHMVVGTDGGHYVTYDRMDHWDHLSGVAVGQFYDVAVDKNKPYRVLGGLQDNGIWLGPSLSTSGPGPINEDWYVVGGGDGFQAAFDPDDSDVVYFESQGGNMARRNVRTGSYARIYPRQVPGKSVRFNWDTPFIVSSHDSNVFYAAGNYVFKSIKKGDDLQICSPEIARTGNGTATALSESPRNPGVLWVGTDDGALWITRDGGLTWVDVGAKVGLSNPFCVATIEASRFVEGRAYVAFDAHRSDDDDPYLFVTEDYGQTWKSIRANLPMGSSRCLREDLVNQNLLFLGTEFGAWASIDRGESWTSLNGNLPTVKVFDFAIHPTAGEIVAATHGRSLWIMDVSTLRQMAADTPSETAHLFTPNTAVRWRNDLQRGAPYGDGHRRYYGENPPRGAQIAYSIGGKAESVKLAVYDVSGQQVRSFLAPNEAGLHVVSWDLTRAASAPGGPPAQGGSGGELGQLDMSMFGRSRAVPAGSYKVVLTVDGKDYVQILRIENDPTLGPDQLGRLQPVEIEEKD